MKTLIKLLLLVVASSFLLAVSASSYTNKLAENVNLTHSLDFTYTNITYKADAQYTSWSAYFADMFDGSTSTWWTPVGWQDNKTYCMTYEWNEPEFVGGIDLRSVQSTYYKAFPKYIKVRPKYSHGWSASTHQFNMFEPTAMNQWQSAQGVYSAFQHNQLFGMDICVDNTASGKYASQSVRLGGVKIFVD